MLGDRHRFAAGQVDQPAEAVLRVFRAQSFYGVIPPVGYFGQNSPKTQ